MGIIMTLLGMLKNPRVLVSALVPTLILLVFLFGHHLGLGLWARIAIGVAIAALGGVFGWLSARRQKRKQAESIEQSLVLEAAAAPDARARERESRDDMATAIGRLKSSRLADGRSGRDALSILPWYLVLGAPGSGKSAAITSSGLPFPGEGRDAASVCSEGRDCCWWFSNQAVLLEASGRFAARQAESEWETFVQLLAKQQRRPALNGVVVVLAADELVARDEVWLREHASLLRRRLDALTASLDWLCPVSLVITRCDRINGFPEFFGDLEGKARDQVWGATFSANLMTSPVPGDVFVQEFDRLARALERRRLRRLIRSEQAREVQQQAFLFPLEFQRLRDKLRVFGETLFGPSAYGHQPGWRGFYFTSAGGETGPVAETVLTDASQVMGLPGFAPLAPPPSASPDSSRRPLFLRTFFLNVLVPDQDLARPTERALRRQRAWRLVLRGAAVLALPVFLALATVSLVRNLDLAGRSGDLADDVRGLVAASTRPRDVAAALGRLEPLREQLGQFDAWGARPPLTLDVGLYRGDRLDDSLRRIYFDRLQHVLLRPGRDALERELLGEYPSNREQFNRFFALYQAYRMLIEPDQGDPGLVARELQAVWREAANEGETTARQLALIDGHVDFAWRHPVDLRQACADLPNASTTVIERAERYITDFWEADLYYENMIEAASREGRPFGIAVEPAFSGVFTGAEGAEADAAVVPFAYTRTGWREHVLPRILGSEEELRENWLLREVFRERTADIRNELITRYLADHHREWTTFLANVDLMPPARLEETLNRMRGLAPRTSALHRFLERARDTMDLGDTTDGLPEAGRAAVRRATDDFHAWREFFRRQGEGDDAREPAGVYAGLLDELVAFLDHLTAEGDPQANAAAASAQVFAEDGRGSTTLESVSAQIAGLVVGGGATSCDRALEAFLRRPVMLTWEACLRATERHLDARWRDDVAREYQARLDRYPLNPASGQDGSVSDFAAFFGPQGTLDLFVVENLAVFLKSNRQPREVLGRGLRLGEPAVAALRDADHLRRVLFPDGANVPRVRFRLRPLQASYARGSGPTITGTRFRVGDMSLFYDMGAPRTVDFLWSGEEYGLEASLTLQPAGQLPELRVGPSDWALFRLLDGAESVKLAETRFEFTFFLEDAQGRFEVKVPYEITTTSADNAFQRGFFAYALPPRLFR